MNTSAKPISSLWKRIILIYIVFHLLALITSTFNIEIHSKYENLKTIDDSHNNIDKHPWLKNTLITYGKMTYYFTGKDKDFEKDDYINSEHFWPNINFFTNDQFEYFSKESRIRYISNRETFWGVFKGYDLSEFIIYSAIPFLLILIKRLW